MPPIEAIREWSSTALIAALVLTVIRYIPAVVKGYLSIVTSLATIGERLHSIERNTRPGGYALSLDGEGDGETHAHGVIVPLATHDRDDVTPIEGARAARENPAPRSADRSLPYRRTRTRTPPKGTGGSP